MSFIPESELKENSGHSLAPMVDFLFIMLIFFASLTLSRIVTQDTEINLVKITPEAAAQGLEEGAEMKIIYLSINENGEYKWVTEIHDYEMASADLVAAELRRQYERGLLPDDKLKTQILVKIDKKAQWEPVLKLLFAIRDEGFEVRPVYEPETAPASLVHG